MLIGITFLQSYKIFDKLIRTCNMIVPDRILNTMKELQNENEERKYGECLFRKLVGHLKELSCCPGAHIFSMNR